jgi:hypothetical protein
MPDLTRRNFLRISAAAARAFRLDGARVKLTVPAVTGHEVVAIEV